MLPLLLLLATQPPAPIDLGETEVRGSRPAPGVIFVDGGIASLRGRMRELAREATQDPLARPEPAVRQSSAQILRAQLTAGDWDLLPLRRASARVAEAASFCPPGKPASLELKFAAGRLRAARILSGAPDTARCAVAWARRARFPSGEATVEISLGLAQLPKAKAGGE